jgi:hypothetical protein
MKFLALTFVHAQNVFDKDVFFMLGTEMPKSAIHHLLTPNTLPVITLQKMKDSFYDKKIKCFKNLLDNVKHSFKQRPRLM